MTDGVIEGQWAYVWAAYVVTWVLLGGYALRLIMGAPKPRPPGGSS